MIPEKIKSVWRSMWGVARNDGNHPPTSSSKLDAAQLFASLSSETLLNIFSKLRSDDMVRLSRVCKSWYEIIQQNRSLWKELLLPRNLEDGWESSIVDLFDSRSASTLNRLTMDISLEEEEEATSLVETLQRSKETLRSLHLIRQCDHDTGINAQLASLLVTLPNLVDCRLLSPHGYWWSFVRLRPREQEEQEVQVLEEEPKDNLKVLWLWSSQVQSVFQSHDQAFNNLSSLVIDGEIEYPELRSILEVARLTLKHLQISTTRSYRSIETDIRDLYLPRLQVLEIKESTGSLVYPRFLRIPPTSTILTHYRILSALPSISKLWTSDLRELLSINARCPVLVEFRVQGPLPQLLSSVRLTRKECSSLCSMLRQRKDNVEDGTEVDGVKMIPLKTLVINTAGIKSETLDELKELVEEVVDIREVPPMMDVEI